MKNNKLKLWGGIVAILIAALITLTFMLDGMVKSGIEETASDLLQTEVQVGNVDLSIFNGSGNIHSFIVNNPDNYSDEPAITIDLAHMELSLPSLFTDRIVVKTLTIQEPKLYFEQRGFGANLKTLIDNMSSPSEDDSDTQLIIKHLLIENSTVKVSTTIDRERTAKTDIGKIELNDVGEQQNYTVRETTRELLRPLLEKAISEALRSGVSSQLKSKVNDLLGS